MDSVFLSLLLLAGLGYAIDAVVEEEDDNDDDVEITTTKTTIPLNNLIEGSDGDDALTGSAAADLIDAKDGDDTVNAGDGDDRVRGGDGDDQLFGEEGSDAFSAARAMTRLTGVTMTTVFLVRQARMISLAAMAMTSLKAARAMTT